MKRAALESITTVELTAAELAPAAGGNIGTVVEFLMELLAPDEIGLDAHEISGGRPDMSQPGSGSGIWAGPDPTTIA
jgi:hypothetical protein